MTNQPPRPKEMELAMQSSFADGRWNVTLQAWIGTKAAADALIRTIEVARDVLPDALPRQTPVGKPPTRSHFDREGCDPPQWHGPTGE